MKKLVLVVLFVLGLFVLYSTNDIDNNSESVEQNRISVQESVHNKQVHNAVINGGER